MKSKSVVFLSAFVLFFTVFGVETGSAAKTESAHDRLMRISRERHGVKTPEQKAAEQPKSIWDDDSSSNPYFKSDRKKVRTAADLKKEKAGREPKRTTFKRRVYTGPSKDEINAAASKKAVENFKVFLADDEYDAQFENASYNTAGDSLSVTGLKIVPVKTDARGRRVPYVMSAAEIIVRGMNIGESNGTPMTKNGELSVRKMEIPVWDEDAVKKGKIEISKMTAAGDIAAFLKERKGKLEKLEITKLRSETIINEAILNNIVRSKIFAADTLVFDKPELGLETAEGLKRQELTGFRFDAAQIDGRNMPDVAAVQAAMTSYSARVLNTDLVLGARLEAQKEKPQINPEQLKKNVAENKAAIAAAEAEMKSN